MMTTGEFLQWQRRIDEIMSGSEDTRYIRLSLFVQDFRTAYDGLYDRLLDGWLSWTEYDISDFHGGVTKKAPMNGAIRKTL